MIGQAQPIKESDLTMTLHMLLETRPAQTLEVGDIFEWNNVEYVVKSGSRDKAKNKFVKVSPTANEKVEMTFQVYGPAIYRKINLDALSAEDKNILLWEIANGIHDGFEEKPAFPHLSDDSFDIYRPRFAKDTRVMSRQEARNRGIPILSDAELARA